VGREARLSYFGFAWNRFGAGGDRRWHQRITHRETQRHANGPGFTSAGIRWTK
jgi:hypothetical protein